MWVAAQRSGVSGQGRSKEKGTSLILAGWGSLGECVQKPRFTLHWGGFAGAQGVEHGTWSVISLRSAKTRVGRQIVGGRAGPRPERSVRPTPSPSRILLDAWPITRDLWQRTCLAHGRRKHWDLELIRFSACYCPQVTGQMGDRMRAGGWWRS